MDRILMVANGAAAAVGVVGVVGVVEHQVYHRLYFSMNDYYRN